MKITDTARDRIVTRLKELGLSTHEALTYTVLLAQPKMTAGALCKETGIPDSKIYYALDGLSEKGMITIQKGNPNIYLPIPPKEAVANLKQQLTQKLDEKLKEADILIDMLSPIYESADKPEELEVAYIIRGKNNIANRMKALIETARKEVTLFVSYPELFNQLKDALQEAKDKRRIKLNIAMPEEILEKENLSSLGEMRVICCPVTLLISDVKTLITVSDWGAESAVLSQDQNLIRVARDYYDNSMCYIK